MTPSPVASTPTSSPSVILQATDTDRHISPPAVISWSLYDFANTIYSLNVISVFFPQMIVRDLKLNDAVYAYPMSLSLLIVALISPLLGGLSDRMGGRRMPWLVVTTMLCVFMTAAMGLLPTSGLGLILAALVISNIGYQTALVFYDALLPSVSNTVNWGKISGLGVGVGYAGALFGGQAVNWIIGKEGASQSAFVPTALLFLVFALPCFLWVQERATVRDASATRERVTWRGSITQTWRTLMEARKVPGLLTFLGANFLYSDALNTVIVAMGVYATQVLGFGSAIEVLSPAIVAAVVGSWLFGLVTDRLSSKHSLILSLLMWVGVFAGAIITMDKAIFQWVIAPIAGVALGSTWTAARTMMIELSPPEKLGEFLGIYNLTGKFSAVLGPLLWGTTLWLLDPRVFGRPAYQVAIGTLLVMVLLGFALHLRTPNISRVPAPRNTPAA